MIKKSQEYRPLGHYLRQERIRLGLIQPELAAIGGVSKATQVAYESNATRPDSAYLTKIGEAGVDVMWLLTGRRSTEIDQWELLFEIEALVDEWVHDRNKPTSRPERNDLVRTLYAQFRSNGRIDQDQMATTFRLVK